MRIAFLISLFISSFVLSAQYMGIDVYTGVGLPLYGEISYPEKNLFIPSNQPCPPLTRPGYFDKGSPSFTVGGLANYAFGKFRLNAGLNYTVYQVETWADPDSALKYAIPICPDPPLSNIQRYHNLNLPIGIGYKLNRWDFRVLYAFPILTRYFRQTTVLSGTSWPSSIASQWFYEKLSTQDPIPHYFQFTLGYNLTNALQVVGFYQFNNIRYLNHISFGLNYSFNHVL
jgi:hypothetical protein